MQASSPEVASSLILHIRFVTPTFFILQPTSLSCGRCAIVYVFAQASSLRFWRSFLPTYVSQPTVGLSGVILAAIGIMWGKTGRFWDAFCVVMPFIVLTMLMPGVNGILHLWAYMIGFIIGRIITKYSHIPYF